MNTGNAFTVKEFKEWSEAKEFFDKGLYGTPWVFRGQQMAEWHLESSLDRAAVGASSDKKEIEKFFIFQFQRRAHNYLQESLLPLDDLEWLALMQHHGAPTRLLDFTKSPYVAVFFGLENAHDACAVWALNTEWYVGQAAYKLADASSNYSSNFVKFSLPNPQTLSKRFTEIFFDRDIPMLYPVEPFRMNERLTVQQGCFLCPGSVAIGFEQNLLSYGHADIPKNVMKIVLHPQVRREALYDLYMMNINRASLFPGIDGFAQSLKHHIFSSEVDRLNQMASETYLKELHLDFQRKHGRSSAETKE